MNMKKIFSILIVIALLMSMMALTIDAHKPGKHYIPPKVTTKPPSSTVIKPSVPVGPILPTPIVPVVPFIIYDMKGIAWDMSSYWGYGWDYDCWDYGYDYSKGKDHGWDKTKGCGCGWNHDYSFDCGWTSKCDWDYDWNWSSACYTGHCTYKCNHTGYFSHCTDKCNHTGYYADYLKYPRIIGGRVEGYVVSYDSKGGSLVSPSYYSHGALSTEPAEPTLAGYTFGGWYYDSNCKIRPYEFDTKVTMSFVLYAKWIPN